MDSDFDSADLSFLGRGWSFPPRFSDDGAELAVASGDEVVRRSLEVLFSTRRYQRALRPEFGCDLDAFAFRGADAQTLCSIEQSVRDGVLRFEPRVEPEAVKAEASPREPARVTVTLTYRVRRTNTRNNMVFPFYLNEGTQILKIDGVGV